MFLYHPVCVLFLRMEVSFRFLFFFILFFIISSSEEKRVERKVSEAQLTSVISFSLSVRGMLRCAAILWTEDEQQLLFTDAVQTDLQNEVHYGGINWSIYQ